MLIHLVLAGVTLLGLAGLISAASCAAQLLARRSVSVRLAAWVWAYPTALWAIAFLVAVMEGAFHGDWVHMYWSVQTPMSWLFLCSGVYLCRTWASTDNPLGADPMQSLLGRAGRPWLPRGAWGYFAMLGLVAVVPFVCLSFDLGRHSERTSPGGPAESLWALIEWSFGAPRPNFLDPVNASQISRGMGHPERDVTLSLGPTLIAAWHWIAYCVIAVIGLAFRPGRTRTIFFLIAPALTALGLGSIRSGDSTWVPAWANVGFLAGRRNDGIWLSTQPVLQTYGRVLLAALLSAAALATLQLIHSRRIR